MSKKFYAIVNYDIPCAAFVIADPNGSYLTFDTEAEAVEACKEYSDGNNLVVTGVVSITTKITQKITRIK